MVITRTNTYSSVPKSRNDHIWQETRRGVLGDPMTILLSVIGVTFAAFCVWLSVRIVNRRERWAKCALAAVIGVPVLYAASFGPACWISSQTLDRGDRIGAQTVNMMYQPILSLAWSGPSIVQSPIVWYARLWSSDRWAFGYVSGSVRWGPLPL